jgi:hypothetical protein
VGIGVRIRDAQPDDADAVANIYVASRKVAWRGIIDDEYLDGLDAMHEARLMRAFLEDPDPGWGTRIAEGPRCSATSRLDQTTKHPDRRTSVLCSSLRSRSGPA